MDSSFSLLKGDCRDLLKTIPDASVDLVFTSPPYAERRKKAYNSIKKSDYVEWFVPIGKEIKRILKPTGSFMLNLKADCDDGERSLYVMELIIALRNQVGLKYIDEYVWYKSASPRKKTFRLKNCWEPIYHFSLGRNYIDHEAIKIKSVATFAHKRGTVSLNSVTGNMGGYHDIAKQQPGFTDPDNILFFPTALLIRDRFPHPAKFPRELAEFFVKGFSPVGGTVLDPFGGSGMTALASIMHNRNAISMEIESKFWKVIEERVQDYYNSKNIIDKNKSCNIFDE